MVVSGGDTMSQFENGTVERLGRVEATLEPDQPLSP
jgi:hypothetical protein